MTTRKIISLPDQSKIEEEASVWLMRLQDGDLPAEDMAEFVAWRSKSNQHREAFDRLAEIWEGLDFINDLEDHAQSDVVEIALRKDQATRWAPRAVRVIAGAMAAAAAIYVGVTFSDLSISNAPTFEQSYQTAIGAQESIDLPDGSQIILNTDSAVNVVFSKGSRDIELARGEAYFTVAKDPDAPFSVATPKGTVTAVGTAFSVRLHDDKIDVVVTEGRVALEAIALPEELSPTDPPPNTLAAQRTEVSAGQSAVIDSGVEAIALVPPDELEKALDWQDGIISFEGETLDQVIISISRYTDLEIEVTGEDLKQQRIVALFRVGDIDRMFEALQIAADLEVDRSSDHRVRLYRSSEL